ncbi:MAG: TlpA family protein disulfide reductase [Armatimonadetes bacterium]|nr:TlpA family protein disulfide reductase [Armatimonadota bacterium]
MKYGLLTFLWVVLMGGAFWKYEGSYLIPRQKTAGALAPTPTHEKIDGIDLSAYDGKILLINFWNPDCGCSEFAEPHVKHLEEKFSNQGVSFVTVIVTDHDGAESGLQKAKDHHLPGKLVLDADGKICKDFDILAAPAAVVYDRSGKAVYRGSYNIARFCNNEDSAFVEQTLDAMISGKGKIKESLPFYGCHTIVSK